MDIERHGARQQGKAREAAPQQMRSSSIGAAQGLLVRGHIHQASSILDRNTIQMY
ncbi:hypothetical protein [Bradyrhizobium mercantei]|uniref:hypothetical protein n=1 Tax=Bradyrhizobium mercantei TaxID=1904807 RepID=UPI0013566D53|nr:hypothetical protein [Bradyrhizobium mercantei]